MENTNDFDPNKADRIIAQALDDEKKGEADNLIRLSTGVVLKARQANPNILIRIMAANKRPQPPVIFNKAMGREMENPVDPDYISRVKSWEMEYSNGMLNALVGLGTTLVSKPINFPGPDDDLWIMEYGEFGLPTHPESPSWRYIAWVLSKACTNEKDTQLIGDKVKSMSGVKEADVQDAESFPAGDKAV